MMRTPILSALTTGLMARAAGCAVVLLALMLALSGRAMAEPIVSFRFEAVVDFADVPWTDNGIAVGDTVSGVFSYDLMAPDSSADPNFGAYNQSIAFGVSISVGGFVFTAADYLVQIYDDPLYSFDGITILFQNDISDGGITVRGLGSSPFLSLSGPTDLFDGDALLPTIDLSRFTNRFGGLLAEDGTQLQYTITSLARIPEAATLPLLMSALSLLVLLSWRRRKPCRIARDLF